MLKQIKNHIALVKLSACCLLLAASCKKEPIQFTFKGKVVESVNSAALAGVDVDISQKTYDGTVASSFFNKAGSGSTDALGNYEISFDREKVVEFKIELSKEGYFDQVEIIPSGDVSPDEQSVHNYILEPKAWITFNLYNADPQSTEEFTMIHYNFKEGCSGCTTNDFFYYYGAVDSTFTYTTSGGVYTRYSYKAPWASVYVMDSVYTTPFDTVEVDIVF